MGNIRVEWVEENPCSTVMLSILGSYFLEMFADKMQVLHGSDNDPVDNKELHNIIFILTSLYNFKVRKNHISNWNLVKLMKKMDGGAYFQQRGRETTFKYINNEHNAPDSLSKFAPLGLISFSVIFDS